MPRLFHSLRFALVGALVAGALVAVACGDDDDDDDDDEPTSTATGTATATEDGNGDEAESATVAIGDNTFSPAEVRIAAGGTVTWEWGGSNPHSVIGTSDNADDIESEVQTSSGDYEVTFDEPGTYEYQCGVHGASMSGTVVVT